MIRARRFSRSSYRWTSLIICLALVLSSLAMSPFVGASNSFSEGRNQARNDKARKAKPAEPRKTLPFTGLPDLDVIKRQPNADPETPAAIPSAIRSRRTPLKPWDGIRVGDPLPNSRASSQSNAESASPTLVQNRLEQPGESNLQRSTANKTRQKSNHTRGRVRAHSAAPPPLPDDQYLQNFFYWTLLRYPNAAEATYWNDILRAAYQRGPTSVLLSVRELGQTLFESAEYAARGRSDQDYVYDLYKTYLNREPDQGGWAYWTSVVPTNGRANVRRGFDYSDELANLCATITPNGSITSAVSSLSTARVDPFNQSGNQLRSRDAGWALSLLNLPGRTGLNLGLSLSYSSLVWTRSGPHIYFDQDTGWPSPGFRLGFPTIQEKSFDAQAGQNVFVMIASSQRVELRQVGSSNTYEAADSSYLQLIDNGGSLLVRSTDGTQFSYGWYNREWRCTQIKDRNGNYISINYDGWGHITTITDTLGRVINFNYDGNANLISITQWWNGGWHTWATFGWGNLTMAQSFSGVSVTGTYNGEVVPVLTQVALHDGTRFNFEYVGTGQVNVIRSYRWDNVQRSYIAYDYTGNSDCPRIYQTRVWAENWTGGNGVPAEVATQINLPGDGSHQMIAPDGTVYKEFYGSGWQKGLTTQSEIWSGGGRQKWTTLGYTQDNTSVSYQTNPRVTETNVYDAGGNRRRKTIDYSIAAYAQYGLPYFVTDYAADGTTELRRTFTDYDLNQSYLDRRLIGLVSAVHLTDGGGFKAKVTYGYDTTTVDSGATTAVQHDQNYHASFGIRGNLTSVSRWDVTDINNPNKALTNTMSYNAAGSVLSTTDPGGHANSFNYGDSFSDGNNSRNTFAYPTTITNADNFSSFVQYNFDFGAKTRVQGPPPAGQSQGAIQTFAYDAAARIQQVTTLNTNAYTRYVYGPFYVESYSTVNTVADEAFAVQVYDGVGRVFGTANNHPGSAGGYRLVNTIYDQMGRPFKQSNPFEITSAWIPAGDDAAGVYYTQQSYDWQGRPLVTTNTDGTQKYASYAGCGCAGGEVVTLTDEVGRQQRVYSDVLGRTRKSEILNWNGSIYSTTTNTFNTQDQVTLLRQWAGSEGSGTYQDTTMSYDGYGRLQSKHVPQQNAGTATVYAYNPDDTIQSITDARGSYATYSYNNRHKITGITYTPSAGVPATPALSFAYDAAGNRTSMTDGVGTMTYYYNQLSQMTSETRTFTGLSGSYALSYGYNLAGQVTSLSEPGQFGAVVNYAHDTAGRLAAVTASGMQVSSLMSGLQYRASGALKHAAYGDGTNLNLSYNNRLLMTRYELNNVNYLTWPPAYVTMGSQNQYHADGRVQYTQDLHDGKFDRSYTFDHAGRMDIAASGREARGEPPANPPDSPYKQTFSYDVWGNMGRTGRLWSGGQSDTPSYANNRRSDWYYDAAGNSLVTFPYKEHQYDATGSKVNVYEETWSGPWDAWTFHQNTIAQVYTGGGQPGKRVETRHSEDYQGTITNDVRTVYHLKSSVLGGETILEIDQWGQREGHVYAGGQKIADYGGWAPYGTMDFRHANPANGNWINVHLPGNGGTRTEFDPLGATVGTYDPIPGQLSYLSMLGNEFMYSELGNPFDLGGGCGTIDGMPASCSEIQNRMESGSVASEYTFHDGQRWRREQGAIVSLGVGLFVGEYPRLRLNNEWRPGDALLDVSWREAVFSFAPQTKKPCTFNINLINRSRVPLSKSNLTAIEKGLNAIFASGGYAATLNNPSAATDPAFNYDLTVYNNFPAVYGERARNDSTTVGYTLSTRLLPESTYPGIHFPGPTGGVSVNHIRDQYGAAHTKPAALANLVARIGAHEMIAHYLLTQPGHPDEYADGVTAEAIGDPTRTDFVISPAVKEQLDKICSSRELPKQ